MLNIVYAGSPDVAAIPLLKLAEAQAKGASFRIVGILTNPASAQKRSKELIPTPVAQTASEIQQKFNLQIPVLTPEKLDAQARNQIASLNPDLLVCFAYGHFFGPKFMELFPLGGINLHPSLLPKYRGCAPVPAAILNLDEKTGVTIQKIAQEMDAGDILEQSIIDLSGTETTSFLLKKAAELGAELLLKIVTEASTKGELPQGKPQDGSLATTCTSLCKEDGCINWQLSAKEIDARVRAFSPWPGTFTEANGNMLKILETCLYPNQCNTENIAGSVIGTDKQFGIMVQTGNGIICIQRLQWQTKKAVNWKEFINGSRNFLGTILGKQD